LTLDQTDTYSRVSGDLYVARQAQALLLSDDLFRRRADSEL
jgi:hypothetical protein